MKDSLILSFIDDRATYLKEIWKISLIGRFFSNTSKIMVKGLNNSMIVSRLCDYKDEVTSTSIVEKIIDFKVNIFNKLSNIVRNTSEKHINNSGILKSTMSFYAFVKTDIYHFISIILGTSALTYLILKAINTSLSISSMIVSLVLISVFFIIGFADFEIDIAFKNSKLIRIISNFFN